MSLTLWMEEEQLPCEERVLEETLEYVLKEEGITAECAISFQIVEEEEIRALNAEYRGVDRITDVLSFPTYFGEYPTPLPNPLVLGDIVVCLPKVYEQAKEYGHSPKREFLYLCVHSLLHLLGYDHMEEEDKREMRTREEIIMKAIGVTRG